MPCAPAALDDKAGWRGLVGSDFLPIPDYNKRVGLHKDKAVRELDLMYEAIQAGDYKKAMEHKIIANVAIDEMVNVSKLVEESDGKRR